MLCGSGLQGLLGGGASRLVQEGGWRGGRLPCRG